MASQKSARRGSARQLGSVCAECFLPIVAGDVLVSFHGESYHSECLTCSDCNQKISGLSHCIQEYGRLCKPCHTSKLLLCQCCRLPVHTANLNGAGPYYHQECWVCGLCDESIKENHYVQGATGNQPVCLACHDSQVPKCAECSMSILEECLHVDGKTYHPACFKCGICARPVASKYCKREDCYLCEPCNAAQSPQCGGCSQPILTEHTTDMDGVPFHHECFRCATCTSQISGAHGRRYSDGLATCTSCKARERPQCTRCSQPLMGRHLTVDDEFFHPECFTCADCEQCISGAYYKRGTDFLCKCCEDARAPQCGWCSQPIWTEHPTVDGVPFHPECFLCNSCDGQISGSFFPNAAGRPTCQRCHEGHAPQCRGCKKPVFGDRISVRGHIYHSHCFACDGCGQGLVDSDGTAQCWQRESRHLCKLCHSDAEAWLARTGCDVDVEECHKVQAKEDRLTSERVEIDSASSPALSAGPSFAAFAALEHKQRDVLVYSPRPVADRHEMDRKPSCDSSGKQGSKAPCMRLGHCASSASTSVGSSDEAAPSDYCSEDSPSPLRSEKGFSFSSVVPAPLQRCKSSTKLCASGSISVSTLRPAFAASAVALLNPKAPKMAVTEVGKDLNSSLLVRCLQAEWREIEKDQKIKDLEARLRRMENKDRADASSEDMIFASNADLDNLCAKSDALILQMSKTLAVEELA